MSKAERFLDALARRPLLLDAAMGTRLIARGLDLRDDDPALWNLSHPEEIRAIHRSDIEAGSDALLTNSFGANDWRLDRLGRRDSLAAINRAAVDLARDAAGPDRFVIGCIGPSDRPNPAQAVALAEAGVDALILETHHEAAVDEVLGWMVRRFRLPVLVSLHRWPDPPGEAARRWADQGAAALGCNCQAGLEGMKPMVESLGRETSLPILVKPSAGLPGSPPARPEDFAQPVPDLLDLGVRLFGGCCGTDETHVAALRRAMSAAFRPLRA